MEPIRWSRRAIPAAALALVGAAALARPPLLEAADPPWDPPPCPAGATTAAEPAAAWFRLDGVVDEAGTLTGQRLVVGVASAGGRSIALPPESFASGPVAGRVLVGADDGSASRLWLVDVGGGCRTAVAQETAVVRSALMTPDGTTVIEHLVDRATRADLGIWRVDARGQATRIVRGLAADNRYGPTFSTDLRWAPDGRLAVTACGEHQCRTRIVDITTGRASAVGPTGPVIGITSDGAVVAYAPCEGFPCPLVRREPGRDATVVAAAAGRAAMAGDRIVFETGRGRISSIDARTGRLTRLDAADGLVPVDTGSLARGGASHRRDTTLLVLGTRLTGRSIRVLPVETVMPAAISETVR